MKTYCTYLRVSTRKQGRSGLGLDAQRKMCADFIATQGGCMSQEFIDVESGTHRDRKGLQDAINYCKQNNCPLVIAKLDRLARDVEFCFKIVNTGVEIHFTDMLQMNTLLLGVFASVAQYERELTSERTKKALAVKKAQGAKLGASNEKYKQTVANKNKEQIHKEEMERGKCKRERYQAKRDTQVFLKVLKNVQPEHCEDEDPAKWEWRGINMKCGRKDKMLSLMKAFKDADADGRLFTGWDFNEDRRKLEMKLCAYIQTMRRTFKV